MFSERLPCFDPEARRVFQEDVSDEDREHAVSHLSFLEEAAASADFDEAEFGVAVPERPGVFASRVGWEGSWMVFWRRLPVTTDLPLCRIHVLSLERVPPPFPYRT